MTNSTSERELTIKTGGESLSIFEIMQRYRNDGSCEHVIQDALQRLSLLDSEAAGQRDFEWALRELADGWINAFEREGPHGFNQNARRVLELIANDAGQEERRAVFARLQKQVDDLDAECDHGNLDPRDVDRLIEAAAANETREDGDDG